MKVFISYAKADRRTAEAIAAALKAAGAEFFQYHETGTAEQVWDQVFRSINDSDAFVVLLSQNALESTAVGEEIKHAHYRYINTKKRNPSMIVPIVLEDEIELPMVIERFGTISFQDEQDGRRRLLEYLGLRPFKFTPLPDLSSTLRLLPSIDLDEASPRRPVSSPDEDRWTTDVTKILTNYHKLKPVDLPQEKEADHVDSVLAGFSGTPSTRFADPDWVTSVNAQFLGFDPAAPQAEDQPTPSSRLGELLLRSNLSETSTPLPPPILTITSPVPGTCFLSWSDVEGATGYVLERCLGPDCYFTTEIYQGPNTSYVDSRESDSGLDYYRVKSVGGVFRSDSEWSNSVHREASPQLPFLRDKLAAPKLVVTARWPWTDVSWTSVLGATEYVLQRSNEITSDWETLYEGPETKYLDKQDQFSLPGSTATAAYRVKAKRLGIESPWSRPGSSFGI